MKPQMKALLVASLVLLQLSAAHGEAAGAPTVGARAANALAGWLRPPAGVRGARRWGRGKRRPLPESRGGAKPDPSSARA